MHDKQTAAIARYNAMAGKLKKMPPKARRRGREDRKRYASRYLTLRRGRVIDDPLKTMRFLVDVCGLTLQEAGQAMRKAKPPARFGRVLSKEENERLARHLYRGTGDLIDAVSLARFYGWASGEPQVWNAVCVALSKMPVAREATGIENWAEAAE